MEIVTLESVKVSMLPELQGWKEKQEAVVTANPFIIITDNKTYEEAKKRRTTYVTARTTVEKQDTLIASKLKNVRDEVKTETKKLVDITLPHEEKQQAEVKKYEAAKEAERLEKERIQKELDEAITNRIEQIYQESKSTIDNLQFQDIKKVTAEFEEVLLKTDTEEFGEFEMQFASKINLIKSQLADKTKSLTEKEQQRIEAEKLAKEREEFEAQKKAKEEADNKAKAESEAKQKAIDEANKKRQDDLDARQKAIDEAEAKRKSEVAAQEKAESDKKAKEKAEKEAKEKAESEAKRLEELKPDREKALQYIESLMFEKEFPDIKNEAIAKALVEIRDGLNSTIIEFNNQILNIK
ncbi:hypothetical protein EV143_104400 [Flavobacterium chryseum]|uniref:hypothetical protein n=1 Tax=Flavobacterium sp. P3160 TaxID=2512113 RepID=UPI00105F05B7|nr:hypothetical protein [Flavobacterium sp. P3160]TDO77633.1 hypothetical protein EV143_104400 [Flavobacterium sp. P3160]